MSRAFGGIHAQSIGDGLGKLAVTAARDSSADAQAACHRLLETMTQEQTFGDDVAIACISLQGA